MRGEVLYLYCEVGKPNRMYEAGLRPARPDPMRTKNAKALGNSERDHVGRVKELPCSVCDLRGPSDAHHIKQGQHYTCVALCKECHQGVHMGWHGRKAAWAIRKMDELDALAVTIERLMK